MEQDSSAAVKLISSVDVVTVAVQALCRLHIQAASPKSSIAREGDVWAATTQGQQQDLSVPQGT